MKGEERSRSKVAEIFSSRTFIRSILNDEFWLHSTHASNSSNGPHTRLDPTCEEHVVRLSFSSFDSSIPPTFKGLNFGRYRGLLVPNVCRVLEARRASSLHAMHLHTAHGYVSIKSQRASQLPPNKPSYPFLQFTNDILTEHRSFFVSWLITLLSKQFSIPQALLW
ncbi:hypothetical protein Lser_V15G42225 [Lactuca serriola]